MLLIPKHCLYKDQLSKLKDLDTCVKAGEISMGTELSLIGCQFGGSAIVLRLLKGPFSFSRWQTFLEDLEFCQKTFHP